MGVDFGDFARELRESDRRGDVINEIRREMRKPLPELRSAVRASAISTLPAKGGLGAWVARGAITVRFRDVGRTAGIKLKMSRKSTKDKADLKSLDETGSIRHPLFGNRSKWYPQVVKARFFSKVWDDHAPVWVKAADDALDRALQKIRG